jgi:lipid-A-disaccharide synthase-like uncharacterized protein
VFGGLVLFIGQFIYEWISGERNNRILLRVAFIAISIGLLLRFGVTENLKK